MVTILYISINKRHSFTAICFQHVRVQYDIIMIATRKINRNRFLAFVQFVGRDARKRRPKISNTIEADYEENKYFNINVSPSLRFVVRS